MMVMVMMVMVVMVVVMVVMILINDRDNSGFCLFQVELHRHNDRLQQPGLSWQALHSHIERCLFVTF